MDGRRFPSWKYGRSNRCRPQLGDGVLRAGRRIRHECGRVCGASPDQRGSACPGRSPAAGSIEHLERPRGDGGPATTRQRLAAALHRRGQRPGSALFRHYLPPGAFAGRFGPTAATIDAIKKQLSGDGLKVTGVSRDGLLVRFQGHRGQGRARLSHRARALPACQRHDRSHHDGGADAAPHDRAVGGCGRRAGQSGRVCIPSTSCTRRARPGAREGRRLPAASPILAARPSMSRCA